MDKTPPTPPASAYDYDSIPEGYYDAVYNRKKGVQSKWHHLKFERVAREIPEGAVHLDVACGPGTFVASLPPTVRSTAVDIALPQIEYARKHYAAANRIFETMQPGKLPFPDGAFDVVTSIELAEHITPEEARQLFKECARVLKKGGRLVVTTPNYASCWPILEWIIGRVSPVSYKEQHITKYNKARLHGILQDCGFEAVGVAAFHFTAPFHAALSWKLADWVAARECREFKFITRKLGNLLLGIARKP